MFTLYKALHNFLDTQIEIVKPSKTVYIESEVVYLLTQKNRKSGKRKKVNTKLQEEVKILKRELE